MSSVAESSLVFWGITASPFLLKMQALADAVGVHYQTIGYLERGEYRPSLLLALQISRLFDLPIETIFSLEPMKPMSSQLFDAGRTE